MSLRKTLDTSLRKFEKYFETQNLIEVSKSALLHNLDLFNQLSGLPVIPVLKGNAYGHGIEQVAAGLRNQNIPYIAVDGYFEALRIREVSKQPILIMGAILPNNFKNMRYDNYTFVVQDSAVIHALGKVGKNIKVHLECNTGMNRYGASYDELESLVELILDYKNLHLEGVMSHLADSDGDDISTVKEAVKKFDACVDKILELGAKPTMFHVAQSAGSLKAQSRHANVMRLGIGLYGINPFPYGHTLHRKLAKELRPAMRLRSTISKVTELHKGDGISYNYTFTAPHSMKIGVLPLGYFEGVNRNLSNKGLVRIGNVYAPIVGRVCMNHTMIDLSHCQANVGDQVIVYSNNTDDDNSIDSIARKHNLLSYNLLTSLSSDVRRVLTD